MSTDEIWNLAEPKTGPILSANVRVAVARQRAVHRTEQTLRERKNELDSAVSLLTEDELQQFIDATDRRKSDRL